MQNLPPGLAAALLRLPALATPSAVATQIRAVNSAARVRAAIAVSGVRVRP